MAHGVDLHDDIYLQPVAPLQRDNAVEDRLPVPISGKIVIGNKETADALRCMHANQTLDVVGTAMPRFASLDIDDGAEAAAKGTSASRVEAPQRTGVSFYVLERKKGWWLALNCRQ